MESGLVAVVAETEFGETLHQMSDERNRRQFYTEVSTLHIWHVTQPYANLICQARWLLGQVNLCPAKIYEGLIHSNRFYGFGESL